MVSFTVTRLPPRSFAKNAVRAFLESLSVTLWVLPPVSRLLTDLNLTFLPALALSRTRPERLALMRNERLPLRATLAFVTV